MEYAVECHYRVHWITGFYPERDLTCCPSCTAFTREVIIGTTSGQLYETAVEEKDKKEKYCKLLFELTEDSEPFVGVQVNVVECESE